MDLLIIFKRKLERAGVTSLNTGIFKLSRSSLKTGISLVIYSQGLVNREHTPTSRTENPQSPPPPPPATYELSDFPLHQL